MNRPDPDLLDLPALVNRTADAALRRHLARALDDDAELAAEATFLHRLRQRLQDRQGDVLEDGAAAEALWRRLQPRLAGARPRRRMALRPPLALAASVLLALAGLYLGFVRAPAEPTVEPAYRLLGAETLMDFRVPSTMSEAAFDRLLERASAYRVSGPGADGVARIATRQPERTARVLREAGLAPWPP